MNSSQFKYHFRKLFSSVSSRLSFSRTMASTSDTNKRKLENLNFDNKAYRSLPLDTEERNYTRTVSNAIFAKVKPTPLKKPSTVIYSLPALEQIDIDRVEVERPEFAEYFSGSKLLPGSQTMAHVYCGHQFGVFAGQLGDGAAIYMGEIVNQRGERWELQLKGAGLTPFSRTADGRKVLRSSIREFLCSEAMHHLGIPTTRAGSCVTSEDTVVRDIFYSGNPINEKCTVVSRIAPTFIRFGSFEIFKTLDEMSDRHGPSVGRTDLLKKLLNYVIETFYPDIDSKGTDEVARYLEFYTEVVKRTARLVALWQCFGFCHGVLNTDNMSILGLTIDYGPFGFMDRFDPEMVCNASDDNSRYTYIKQPEICKWNCLKLAEAIQAALPLEQSKKVLSDVYSSEYNASYLNKMRLKFGLIKVVDDESGNIPTDRALIEGFLSVMAETGADFTNSFRALNEIILPGLPDHENSLKKFKERVILNCSTLQELLQVLESETKSRKFQLMFMLLKSDPSLLAQFGLGQETIEKMVTKFETVEKYKQMTPDTKAIEDLIKWSTWIQQYAKRLKYEVEDIKENEECLKKTQEDYIQKLNSNNARFVLRNSIAQTAIEKAEKGDFSEVWRVMKILENPFVEKLDPVIHFQNIPIESVKLEPLHEDLYNRKPSHARGKLRVT